MMLLNSYRFAAAGGYDPDAQAMFDARDALGFDPTAAYKDAISDYVTAIKAVSGFWDNIIQLVVTAGTTDPAAACIAIKGNNLTPANIVSGNINIKTGIKGDSTSKYLDTGYGGNPAGAGQNNFHMYGHFTEKNTVTGVSNARTLCGNGAGDGDGRRVIAQRTESGNRVFHRMNGSIVTATDGEYIGDHGLARGSSATVDYLLPSTYASYADTSVAPESGNYLVLARGPVTGSTPTADTFANARVLIWALGAYVDLRDYQTPRADLITALNAI